MVYFYFSVPVALSDTLGISICFSSPEPKAPEELIGQAVCRRLGSTLSNDISFEATGPIEPKFHL